MAKSIFSNIFKVLKDLSSLNFDLNEPLSLLMIGLSVIVTALAIYLGWLYTKTKCNGGKTTQQSTLADLKDSDGNDLSDANKMPRCPFSGKADAASWPTDNADYGLLEDQGKETDPAEFCNHIQREYKKSQQKVALKQIEKDLSQQQIDEEREAKRKQLEAIFKLMDGQNDKFGVDGVDDMQEQMKLYM